MPSGYRGVRRARGRLEELVRAVCDLADQGKLPLGEDEYLTPNRLADEIARRFPGSGKRPSPGGLAELLKRWREVGYIETREEPLAFVTYTPEAFSKGLAQLKAEWRAERALVSLGRDLRGEAPTGPSEAA